MGCGADAGWWWGEVKEPRILVAGVTAPHIFSRIEILGAKVIIFREVCKYCCVQLTFVCRLPARKIPECRYIGRCAADANCGLTVGTIDFLSRKYMIINVLQRKIAVIRKI